MLLSLSGLYTCHHQHESINSILGTICSEGYHQPLPDLFFFFSATDLQNGLLFFYFYLANFIFHHTAHLLSCLCGLLCV